MTKHIEFEINLNKDYLIDGDVEDFENDTEFTAEDIINEALWDGTFMIDLLRSFKIKRVWYEEDE